VPPYWHVLFLRRVLAEFPLLPWRVARTRLGLWLALLFVGLARLAGGETDPAAVAVLAGTMGAVVCVSGVAGSAADRAALTHRLLQPTTPIALAAGRWLAAAGGAAALVAGVAGYAACTTRDGPGAVGAAAAGLTAAAAVSAVVLPLVWTGGNALAVLTFAWLVLVSAMPPEAVIGLGRGGALAVFGASVLEVGPAMWRYRGVAAGDLGAAAHAAAWVGLGLGIAAWRAARLGARRL